MVASIACAAAGLLLALAAGGPAAAHAVLVGTDPPDGSVLEAPPDELTITFNEPVQVPAQGTTVFAGDGSSVEVDVVAVDNTVVITPATPLTDGTYVVSWRVISLDTHPVAGAFTFSVGAPGTAAVDARVAEPTGPLVAIRALDQAAVYTGTFLIAGLVVFELLVLHVSPGAALALRRRLQRVREAALVVAVVSAVLAAPLTVSWQAGAGLGALADPAVWTTAITSDTALAGLLVITGLVAATLATARAGRQMRTVWPAGVALGGAALALGALLLVGHTRTSGPPWLVLTADALHVIAGAVWLGGVVGLALTLMPSAQVDQRRVAVTVGRFSALGAWLVLALAITGVALAWRIIGTLEGLFTTAYGQTLLIKIAIALIIIAIAAWNRYRLVPALSGTGGRNRAVAGAPNRRLGRTVSAEAALLVVVLAVTGALVSTSPVPAVPAASDAVAPEPVEVVGELGDGTLRARVTPSRAGVNAVEIELLDAQGGPIEPVAVPQLSITLADPALGPFTRPLSATGPGRYEGTLDLPLPGSWTLVASVRTSKYENPVVRIPLEVAP